VKIYPAEKTKKVIDREIEASQGKGWRNHLGASIIGKECARQLWYTFRWAKRIAHDARLLRLFNRGHREEPALVQMLRRSGVHVLEEDPETGKQFRILDHGGHFGGSLDSKLYDVPEFRLTWILGEYKTYSSKSYAQLQKKGLAKHKWEHVVQMQIYMHYEELPAALYIPVAKDNDDMDPLIVEYDESVALKYIDRAAKIIFAPSPPPKISESPAYYKCKWCDYYEICHHNENKAKNCRTCVNAEPVDNGQWECLLFNHILTIKEQELGCVNHDEILEE